MHNREEGISQKLKEAENKIAKQRQTLDTEVKKKRQELSVLAAQLQDQHLQMNRKMRKMEEQAEHLECEEKRIEEMKQKDSLELAERTSVLDIRQQQLQEEFERLNVERETMSFVQLQLEDSRRQLIEATQSLAHSQSEVSFLRNIQQQCAHLRYELDATRFKLDNLTEMQLQKSSEAKAPVSQVQHMEMIDKGLQTVILQFPETRGTEVQTSPEPDNITQDKCIDMEIVQSQQQMHQQLQYLRDMLRQVQRENEELRGHTQQQRLRIDELTSHAADLANQLEDAHTAITLFSNHPATEPGPSEPRLLQPMFLSPGPGTITVPPLIAPPPPPPPPPLPPQSPLLSCQMGAGEELNYVTPPTLQQPPLPPTSFSLSSGFSNISHGREWRKKPPRRLMVHSNSNSSEETSPTEEILQEARRRLRKLEEESEAVDRSYQNFRRRQESLVPTTSLLFHSVLPSHLHYNNSSFGYGNFTSSQPLYSSATGGNNMPVFSNFNYDNRPSSSRHNDVLFTPLTSNRSRIFPSVYQNERIPSAIPFTIPSDMEYRSQPFGSADNILGRITSQPRYPGLNSTLPSQSRVMTNPTESRFSFSPQPSTSSGLPRNTDSLRSRFEKINSSTEIHNLNNYNFAFAESHNQNHQTKTVTFGSPLKTTMVYTSPQVSSTESLVRQSGNNSALITVQSDISARPVISTVQSSSRNENIVREINRIPWFASKLQDNADSSLHHFPGSDMPDDQQTSLTRRLSTDNIRQVCYKLSSYFNPSVEYEIPIKCSTSVEKDITVPSNDSESSSIKKIFVTTSDTSKSRTTLSEDLHPSGSFVLSETTEGGSTEYDIHPVCDVSSNTFSGSVKDPSLGSTSTGKEFLIQPDNVNGKELDILTTHDEEILSEISGSVTHTQTTVKHKEGGTSESNISLARSSEHKLLSLNQNEMKENSPKDSECKTSEKRQSENIFKESQNIIYSLPSTSKDTGNERHVTEACKVTEVPVLSLEIPTAVLDKNHVRNTSETYQAVAALENPVDTDPEIALSSETYEAVVDLEISTDTNPNIVMISKTEKFKSESLTEEESENAISTGDQSKKDESNKDDFW